MEEMRDSARGVDFSSVAIERCRERRPEFDWLVHDLTTGPIPGSFDAVICSEVLEHLDSPRPAVHHLAAGVKPGGVLILTVPHGKGAHGLPLGLQLVGPFDSDMPLLGWARWVAEKLA